MRLRGVAPVRRAIARGELAPCVTLLRIVRDAELGDGLSMCWPLFVFVGSRTIDKDSTRLANGIMSSTGHFARDSCRLLKRR
jgi:hypothetical protein